jgi:hypothetical protein
MSFEECCLLGCYAVWRRNNPEDTILHSHRRENLKSYKSVFCWDCSSMFVRLYCFEMHWTRSTVTLVGLLSAEKADSFL